MGQSRGVNSHEDHMSRDDGLTRLARALAQRATVDGQTDGNVERTR